MGFASFYAQIYDILGFQAQKQDSQRVIILSDSPGPWKQSIKLQSYLQKENWPNFLVLTKGVKRNEILSFFVQCVFFVNPFEWGGQL